MEIQIYLESCPFCGSKPEARVSDGDDERVSCVNVDCPIAFKTMSPSEWNTRGITVPHDAALKNYEIAVSAEADGLRGRLFLFRVKSFEIQNPGDGGTSILIKVGNDSMKKLLNVVVAGDSVP